MKSAYYEVYHHYFKRDGKRYLATVSKMKDNNGQNGEKFILHNLVQLDFKIDGEYVRPGVIEYFFPLRNSRHGGSVYDLSADKQNALSVLLNSATYKTVRASLGGNIFVDDTLPNLENIKNMTLDPKVIPVDTMGGMKKLSEISHEMKRDAVPDDNYTLQDRLYARTSVETGVSM